MNRHPLLSENENKKISVGLSLLLCLSMFTTWQMGVMLFSNKSLSIGAKTPIPFALNSNVITALVTAGFIVDILFLIFLQRHSVMAARLSVGIALLSALMFYLPLPPHMAAMLFYIQAFCCVFLIGSLIAVIVNLLTEKAAIKEVIISMTSSGCLIAILQNDVLPIPFSVFRGYMIVALVMLLMFFCKMPKGTWPEYAKKSDSLVKPKAFMVQLFALIGFSSVITLFWQHRCIQRGAWHFRILSVLRCLWHNTCGALEKVSHHASEKCIGDDRRGSTWLSPCHCFTAYPEAVTSGLCFTRCGRYQRYVLLFRCCHGKAVSIPVHYSGHHRAWFCDITVTSDAASRIA